MDDKLDLSVIGEVRMARIKDVAAAAGVSTATVSRVINKHSSVSESTRRKVLEVIAKLNYVPNHGGRLLRTQETKSILVLVPDIRNSFYANILYGMDRLASDHQYTLIIASTYSDVIRERNLINLLQQKLADGMILLASVLGESELVKLDQDYHLVQLCEFNQGTTLTHISVDNYQAAYEAMTHLISKGHEKIAFLSANNNFLSTKLREMAYIQALKDHNIMPDEGLLIRGSYSFESGRIGTNIVMNAVSPPTAIFAISDVVAAGAIQALYRLNLRTPADVAVCGFDDIDMASQLTPPLTTVAQPLEMLGTMAAKILLDKIAGKEVKRSTVLQHQLMIRGTT
jgi:LacI family repressor for deo operon, udp, cdd, tsx, nupC, and nupG